MESVLFHSLTREHTFSLPLSFSLITCLFIQLLGRESCWVQSFLVVVLMFLC